MTDTPYSYAIHFGEQKQKPDLFLRGKTSISQNELNDVLKKAGYHLLDHEGEKGVTLVLTEKSGGKVCSRELLMEMLQFVAGKRTTKEERRQRFDILLKPKTVKPDVKFQITVKSNYGDVSFEAEKPLSSDAKTKIQMLAKVKISGNHSHDSKAENITTSHWDYNIEPNGKENQIALKNAAEAIRQFCTGEVNTQSLSRVFRAESNKPRSKGAQPQPQPQTRSVNIPVTALPEIAPPSQTTQYIDTLHGRGLSDVLYTLHNNGLYEEFCKLAEKNLDIKLEHLKIVIKDEVRDVLKVTSNWDNHKGAFPLLLKSDIEKLETFLMKLKLENDKGFKLTKNKLREFINLAASGKISISEIFREMGKKEARAIDHVSIEAAFDETQDEDGYKTPGPILELRKKVNQKVRGLKNLNSSHHRFSNNEQRDAAAKIENYDFVVMLGGVGSGKTRISAKMAAYLWARGAVDRIYVLRPNVESGKSLGALPGDLKQKNDPYMRPAMDELCKEFGDGKNAHTGEELVKEMENKGAIIVDSINHIRGKNCPRAFVMIDEAQNCSYEQLYAAATRMEGDASKTVATGDAEQTDLGIPIEDVPLSILTRQLKSAKSKLKYCISVELPADENNPRHRALGEIKGIFGNVRQEDQAARKDREKDKKGGERSRIDVSQLQRLLGEAGIDAHDVVQQLVDDMTVKARSSQRRHNGNGANGAHRRNGPQ